MAKKQQPQRQPVQPTPAPQQPRKTEPTAQAMPARKMSLTLKLSLLLGVLTFVIYFNTLQNGFVLDDTMVYAKNTIVNQGFDGIPELLKTPRLKGFGYLKNENYRPLSLVMFAAEVGMFGLNATAAHFFNILFFAVCVILLFHFLNKLLEGKTVVAFIAALLFAVHPIHTEVVANIKSLDEIFCFLFAFLSLNIFVSYMRTGKIWWLLLGLISLFLSFLSKETVITFLGIIPLVFFFYINNDKRRAIFMTAGAAVVAGVYLLIRHNILSDYGASTSAVEFIDNALVGAPSMAMRLATAFFTLGMYVKLLFIPHPLINDYGYNSVPYVGFGNVWVLLSVVIYVAAGVAGLYRLVKYKKDPWAFGILFYMATIALFSNIVFLMGSAMGERFLFFASAGFCLLAALAIEKWILKADISYDSFVKNKLALGILIPVCLIFSYLTFARNAEWKDNPTLFKTDLAKAPENARLNYYIGNELVENVLPQEKDTAKRREILNEGIERLHKAISIFPRYTDAYTELGTAYLNLQRYDSAEVNFKIAISQSAYQSIAANNLGTVYLRTNRPAEAIPYYKLAIQIKGDFVQAMCNMASCYSVLKQFDSAILWLNQSLAIDPNYADAYMQLGLAYYFNNKYAEAEPYFRKAMEMNPTDVNAANNLGAVYLNSGKLQQAADIFKQVVAANPGYVNAYSNLGHCYYQMKQYQAAIDIITRSLQVDPNNVKDIPYIALSYKALGRMAEAAQYEAIAKKYYPDFKL
ncbi:hypothetical protein GCM10023093_12690 [Nemorincola caseinilytica]|uniref:Dolichyl-phosphate-mannose--protein mannosyltransferase n=1 Tax=Nemorincola caseinilytica TaxID=2054315 RepID=A0ABP8NCS8_9BACT